MTRRVTGCALALVVALGLSALTACSPRSEPSEPATAQTPTPTSTVPVVDPDAVIKDFTQAVYGFQYDTARDMVSPGSAAERYMTHLVAIDTAFTTNGQTTQDEAPTLVVDDGVATGTYSDGTEFVWQDFTVDAAGLITGWTTPSGVLDKLLWTTPWQGTVAGNTIDLVSAYKSTNGYLWVVLKVTAGASGIDVGAYTSSLVGTDGIAYTPDATRTIAPASTVPAGAAAYVVLTFPKAPFGGTVHLQGWDAEYNDWDAAIPVS